MATVVAAKRQDGKGGEETEVNEEGRGWRREAASRGSGGRWVLVCNSGRQNHGESTEHLLQRISHGQTASRPRALQRMGFDLNIILIFSVF